MKRLLYLLYCVFAALLVGCSSNAEDSTKKKDKEDSSEKVMTGSAKEITSTGALLTGKVLVDIESYSKVEFGILLSTSKNEVLEGSGTEFLGDFLKWKKFEVNTTLLTPATKYYYRAYLLLNGMQYEFGEVKDFTTLSSGEQPSNPSNPSAGSVVAKPFSVSAFKTVTFSPGNLQYHAANNEWRFAPSQLDYIGEDNANISSTYNGWIDLFGWGTGNNPTNESTDYDDYQTFIDWGANRIGSYAPNTWRTLTYNEWDYIINNRPNASNLKGVAMVDGVNGLILPDAWQCPNGVTFKSGFANNYGSEYYATYQSFSASEWSKLESSGAVFLPAAADRSGSNVYLVQYNGYYWSATEYGSYYARLLGFYSHEANMGRGNRYFGQSVRLVQD